jgi:RNA polymerase sigma factor (sigma-70 family)
MDLPEATDSQLLSTWLARREESAFRALVERHGRFVHSVARRACQDDAQAADVSQLVFILLAQKAGSLTSRTSIAGWLHLTAVKQAQNFLAKSRREARKLHHFQTHMETPHTPDPAASWQEIRPQLDQALAALSESDRETLLLRFHRSMSIKEIAATLGLTANTAQKRLDRATERLREKLTRRGVTTAGSLSAVMLAGFSTDAQAAVISTSILSSKAIAASAAAPTSIFATLLTMKAASYIAPAVLILLSGTWLVSQRLKISDLNQRSHSLEMALTAHSTDSDQAATPQSAQAAKANGAHSKIDLQAMISEFSKSRSSSMAELRFVTKYSEIFKSLSVEELGSVIQELITLGTTDKRASELADRILPMLCRRNFPYAFDHFQSRLEEIHEDVVTDFKEWADQDLGAEVVWLDQQIASGKLDSKALDGPNPMRVMFESHLFQALFRSDPAAASARLVALPEQERGFAFSQTYYRAAPLNTSQLVQISGLIRSYMPPKDQAATIAVLAYANGNTDFPKAAALLDLIQASQAERNAIAMNLAFHPYDKPVSQNVLDELRADVRKIAPQQVDAATGHALAAEMLRGGMSFDQAATLALHYYEAGAGDDLLIHLCNSPGGKKNKPAARLLAEKISDPKRRAGILNQLK